MGWEEQLFGLFDDLERQAEEIFTEERDLELADRSRAEYTQVTLASRLMASVDRTVAVDVRGVGQLQGTLTRVGAHWCLLTSVGHDWVLRAGAITTVSGASPRSYPEAAWSAVHRLGLGSALRRIADSGDRCVVHLVDGRRHDVRLVRVGLDFVEAVAGEGDGAREVLLPFAVIAAVQSRELS
jgi:hypothetical protein